MKNDEISETVVGVICLTVVVLAFMALVLLGGCTLHLHVGERHMHRANEPAKVVDVLDGILERLEDEHGESFAGDVVR